MKKLLTVFFVLIMTLSLTACGTTSSAGGSGTGASGKAGNSEIVIGDLQDTSGPTSVWGKAINQGIEMAVAKINQDGGVLGKKLRVIEYDEQANVQDAINAYNRLTMSDKVSAIIGPPFANIGIALAPISEQKKVPMIGGFIDDRATTKPDGTPYKYMFLMQPSASQQAVIMASYAMDKLNLKKFAVLYNQANAYSVSLSKPFEDYVKSHGGQIIDEEVYKATDKDYSTQLAKIKASGAEAIYAPDYIQELTLIAQQARSLGITEPIIAGLDAAPPFASMAGSASNNVIFPNNFSYDEPQLQDVYKAYQAKYNEQPLNKVFIGYDSVLLVAQAIKNANSTDPEKIAEAMANLKDVQGTTGKISISPKTHRPYGLSMVMFEIQNGKYVPKGRYLAQELQNQ